jgi:type II secretory pathway component PulJ
MGFAALIDIAGSVVIGGFLLLILFGMNDNAARNTYNFTGELTVQENLVAVVQLLEYDFRKIGYCENPLALPKPEENALLYADTSSITFLTDAMIGPGYTKGDGVVDTLRYYLGSNAELSRTPNPRDRFLYRKLNNNSPSRVNLGITYFKIRYFRDSLTASGSTTLAEIPPNTLPKAYVAGTPTGITAMQIDIKVENAASYDANNNSYRSVFWRQLRLSSRNLKR